VNKHVNIAVEKNNCSCLRNFFIAVIGFET
jgi:hypothetical protein